MIFGRKLRLRGEFGVIVRVGVEILGWISVSVGREVVLERVG